MNEILYERPRERLRRSGAASLTLVELLQVIIGSGNSKASSARIAKRVEALTQDASRHVSYASLIEVPGVGDAKACLILAAFEVSARVKDSTHQTHDNLMDLTRVRKSQVLLLSAQYIGGSGAPIGEYYEKLDSRNQAVVVSRMFGEALSCGARAVTVAVGWRRQETSTLSDDVLAIVKRIYDSSKLIEVSVAQVSLVSETDTRVIPRGDIV